ncbi:energy-coupling factor transporter transmembrane component T [uncultured Granulicatella sp.]|uniref:energy-coupling factor transporter transmembrane component T family protein n=1 Tax=uncultured Granulicatella sp. TaxID=316089 RepID=UPI0028D34B42|nr:energy-coupling factor transporter transmembrane component T [uncultured Granulicatella sp.]
MLDKLLLGRYLQGDSFIHRLDPRTKFLATFLFIIIVFLANNWLTYFILAIFTMLALLASKIPMSFFWNGVKPLLWVILFTVVLQMVFTTGGEVYVEWAFIKITSYGVINAIFIFLRFMFIIFISTLMTLTTPPLQIADAMESIMKPLGKIGVPVHEIALMLSIALRFVPTLMDEAQKIMNAQRARGVDFGEGNLFEQMKAIIPILIPLFVSSFNRAEDLATAMEARGYQGGTGRSKYRVLTYGKIDGIAATSLVILTIALVLFRGQ